MIWNDWWTTTTYYGKRQLSRHQPKKKKFEMQKWDDHVKQVKKGTWFHQMKLIQCPQNIKIIAYKILARPISEFARTAWDSHFKKDIELEMAQRRKRCAFRHHQLPVQRTRLCVKGNWKTQIQTTRKEKKTHSLRLYVQDNQKCHKEKGSDYATFLFTITK